MTRVLRGVGNAVLTVVAVLGVASVLVWGATALGQIKPLVVISGSMSPGIMTGDLVVDRPHDPSAVRVGQVASLHSIVTGRTITHRVVSVSPDPDGSWSFTLKGDANRSVDSETYVVRGPVWQPVLQLSGWGRVLTGLTRPAVAVPLAVTLLALLGISLFPSDPEEKATGRRARDRSRDRSRRSYRVSPAEPAEQPDLVDASATRPPVPIE